MRQWHCGAAHRRYISRCLDLTFEACRHEFPEAVEGVSQKTGRNSVRAATGLVVETKSSRGARGPNDEIRSQSWRYLPGRCCPGVGGSVGPSRGQALATRGAWSCPATGPEKMPELVRVRSKSDGTKPRAAHKAAHGVLNQVPMRAGTPDDLNDSIWTIGPTSAVTSGTARPGLHVSLDVYRRAWRRQRRTVPTSRTGVPGGAATGVQGPSFRA